MEDNEKITDRKLAKTSLSFFVQFLHMHKQEGGDKI